MAKKRKKSCHGTCSVEVVGNAIRLRFSLDGRQKAFHPGLSDTRENRKKAALIAKQVEFDLATNGFDPSLTRYKNKPEAAATLSCLFAGFIVFKESQVYCRTLGKYHALAKHITDSGIGNKLATNLSEVDIAKLIGYLKKQCQLKAVKERLRLVRACLEWKGIENRYLDAAIRGIKPHPKMPVTPFTKTEVQAILEALFIVNPHYVQFVKFLLLTGVRTGEARALKWEHITESGIWIGECLTHGENRPAKCYKARIIPINERLRELLNFNCTQNHNELIFTTPTSRPIDEDNFANRVWKQTLKLAGVRYRRPNNCRATFVSHALQNGLTPVETAAITGHNVEVLYRHYTGLVTQASLPELF
ncbi:tyrosine-type recombinase/integrase [Chroococcidiopsis sp. FACHB-1243]|uniref:tyrosine-type recombinase/integrase n=1 Tax=Chroococcidiopsis sp. [FACHB-1243] TaxID=2692781 RepID=UPI00177C6CCD|nr:tyrosine-type recombinase/integrase [Chroococcidiopsis sp. [FACHB-1243]]